MTEPNRIHRPSVVSRMRRRRGCRAHQSASESVYANTRNQAMYTRSIARTNPGVISGTSHSQAGRPPCNQYVGTVEPVVPHKRCPREESARFQTVKALKTYAEYEHTYQSIDNVTAQPCEKPQVRKLVDRDNQADGRMPPEQNRVAEPTVEALRTFTTASRAATTTAWASAKPKIRHSADVRQASRGTRTARRPGRSSRWPVSMSGEKKSMLRQLNR